MSSDKTEFGPKPYENLFCDELLINFPLRRKINKFNIFQKLISLFFPHICDIFVKYLILTTFIVFTWKKLKILLKKVW